eukprot:6194509-Pyramimonas_sp.AAC.1
MRMSNKMKSMSRAISAQRRVAGRAVNMMTLMRRMRWGKRKRDITFCHVTDFSVMRALCEDAPNDEEGCADNDDDDGDDDDGGEGVGDDDGDDDEDDDADDVDDDAGDDDDDDGDANADDAAGDNGDAADDDDDAGDADDGGVDGDGVGDEDVEEGDGVPSQDAPRPTWKTMPETTNGIHYASNDTETGVDVDSLCLYKDCAPNLPPRPSHPP